MRRPTRWILGALLCLAGGATAPRAQTQIAQPTFRTEANFVRVDVYPTRNGTPVTDLRAQDFQILEDKLPQKIEEFEHVVIRGDISGVMTAIRSSGPVMRSIASTSGLRMAREAAIST